MKKRKKQLIALLLGTLMVGALLCGAGVLAYKNFTKEAPTKTTITACLKS